MIISIEFGTVEFARMFAALRADNGWNLKDSPGHPEVVAARAELANCFYPDEPTWRRGVIERCDEVLKRTLECVVEQLHVRATSTPHVPPPLFAESPLPW
jgi:hypothetical protein